MPSACSGSGDGLCYTALDAVSRKYSGVMPGDVHSSQQREERTKKCRRCYRALSFGGWRHLRGLRNSLRSDNPRLHARGRLASSRPDKGGKGNAVRVVLIIPRNDAESRNTVCHSRLDLESRKFSGCFLLGILFRLHVLSSYWDPASGCEVTGRVIPHLMRYPGNIGRNHLHLIAEE